MARTIVLQKSVGTLNAWAEYSPGISGVKRKGPDSKENMKDFIKIYLELMKQMGLAITETEGGLYLPTIGYFFIWKIPRKMTYRITAKGKKRESRYNTHTGMFRYAPMFFPARKIQYTSMDYTFSFDLKQRLKDNLIGGKKYKFYLTHLYNKLRPKGLGNKVRANVENQSNNSGGQNAAE